MSGEGVEVASFLSLATASVAFTVSEATVFAGVRTWVGKRNQALGKLLSCGYCVSHWVAFALVAVYRPRLLRVWWPLDYFLTALVIAWLAAFQWAALCWMMERTGK